MLPAALLMGLLRLTPAWAEDAATCSGDCNGDGMVTVNELLLAVNIATMESVPVELCPSADMDGDGSVTIDEIVVEVGHALNGCGVDPQPAVAQSHSGWRGVASF